MSELRYLLSGLVAAIVVVGCGDTKTSSETTVLDDLCVRQNIDCNDPSGAITCDPVDAVCKCGGAIGNGIVCGRGERCVVDASVSPASPSCVSELCDAASCGRYETCDPLDGFCKCGGIQCASGFTCVDGVCEEGDPCDGISCGDGETCDPADKICKCGAGICSVGEACRDGQCVGRNCVGVNCPEGTECSSADGLCHCGDAGGPLCTAGQLCVVDSDTGGGSCAGPDICEKVECEGGTVCSPLDGRCHCGGFDAAAPVCGARQTCDQVNRRCMGGDMCGSIACESNMSCDDEDGICKCGGEGGVICGAEKVCVSGIDASVTHCATHCNPLTTNVEVEVCGAPSYQVGCYYGSDSSIAFCAPAGTRSNGDLCTRATDCVAGHHCVASGNLGVCRRYCDHSAPNESDKSCRLVSGTACVRLSGAEAVIPDLGVCLNVGI